MKQSEKLTETEIIERVLKGEKSLYELIVRRFNSSLYKIGRSYHYNHEDTQDLMQDTYVDAFKSLSQFENRSNFKTWIIRIMMNNCYRKREKSSFKHEIMQDVNDHSIPMFTNRNNETDRKSTRLNSSHVKISYAVFCYPPDLHSFPTRRSSDLDTYVDAFKSLSQFENRSNFKTWIIRIMMNNCYRKREKSSFKNEIMQDVNDHSIPMFTNRNNETDNVVQSRELKHIIEDALIRIPLEYRMVFSLREINGLNVSETAAMMNITEANVKVRLNRAKTMLRTEIENAYSASELFEF